MTIDRLNDLKAKGWPNLDKAERAEYKLLKDSLEHSETGKTTLDVKLGKVGPPPEAASLRLACEELYKTIKDGDARAIILRYKELKTNDPLIKTLYQMMKDLPSGDQKEEVYTLIRRIENGRARSQKTKEETEY